MPANGWRFVPRVNYFVRTGQVNCRLTLQSIAVKFTTTSLLTKYLLRLISYLTRLYGIYRTIRL